MKPFIECVIPESEIHQQAEAIMEQWLLGRPDVLAAFNTADPDTAETMIFTFTRGLAAHPVWKNDLYQVMAREQEDKWVMLSIKRLDRQPIHDWRHLQEIKNKLVGYECEGIEIYPAESRLVDTANQYFMFVNRDQAFRFPFGFDERVVTNAPIGKSQQRPFEEAE